MKFTPREIHKMNSEGGELGYPVHEGDPLYIERKQPSKREKALNYLRQYAEDSPDQEINADWLTDLSFDGLGHTLKSLIVVFGGTEEIMKHSGTNLGYLINQIKN